MIVQDLGLASLLKKIAPEMEVHASTQMTITSPEGLSFVNGLLGLERAVLARELSVEEISRVGKHSEVPLEVFVHGALCVAYSGQCLTSESLGQRSANRGECAQACRMPYDLVVDGEDVPLGEMGEVRYLLSPQDLAAVDLIPDLVKAGVKSYKIEGRLKSPEYVAAVTRAYRKALDSAHEGFALRALGHNQDRKTISPEDKYMLEMTFSRGLSTGWLAGTNHPYLTHGKWGKKRGVFVGSIVASGDGWVELETGAFLVGSANTPSSAGEGGEGVVLPKAGEGLRVPCSESVRPAEVGERLRLVFDKRAKIDWGKVSVGQDLYKTSDPKLESAVRKMWKGVRLKEKGDELDLVVKGAVGEKLVVVCRGKMVESQEVLVKAEKRALSEEFLAGQFSRLGGTGFSLGEVEFLVEGEVMVPVSELNRMRRALVESLEEKEKMVNDGRLALNASGYSFAKASADGSSSEGAENDAVKLRVLCRSLAQVRGALAAGCDFLYADFEDLREYKEAVALVRESEGAEIYLATPRIQKPGEAGFFKLVERAEPDGVLVRNLGAVEYFKEAGMKRVGDFSLNVARQAC